MDDFNNFFDRKPANQPDRTPIYHTPEPKRKNNASPALIISIILAVVMCIVVVANVIVLASLKNTIATEYANKMAQQMREQYAEAIKDALSQEGIVDDVTDAAINGALDALNGSIGEVADVCAASVARLKMYKRTPASFTVSSPDAYATAFLITDSTQATPYRYLITNAHCVRYAEKSSGGIFSSTVVSWTSFKALACRFEGDDKDYSARIISYGGYRDKIDDASVAPETGREDLPDLAIIRIDGASQPDNDKHPSLKIAADDYTSRGEPVAIIGNPEGFGANNSISAGIISQTDISMASWGSGSFILTDAAINGGNSGGPMVNRLGVVVGVVESKIVSEDIDNMGFALSAATLKSFIEWSQIAGNNALSQTLTINCTYAQG